MTHACRSVIFDAVSQMCDTTAQACHNDNDLFHASSHAMLWYSTHIYGAQLHVYAIAGKVILDVHHRVRVLASVCLGATAGAGRNGHTMLSAGHVTSHWDV